MTAKCIVQAGPDPSVADHDRYVTLGGAVGHAAAACAARFRYAPFDSLPWLRADLTGEKVSQWDEGWGHVMNRPFKNFSGDISGRFIEIMAMDSRGDLAVHPAFAGLLEEVYRQQRSGGYFCASGQIDWQQPIDHPREGDAPLSSRMLPALWGNARLLCGLVETMRAFPGDKAAARAARDLGDFYITMLPRFNDPDRAAEYTAGGTYAAGYVTCWFPAMEGLVKLSALTGETKYLDAAVAMAAFYRQFDRLPTDHAHGMLCNYASLLLIHQATGNAEYLARVEQRWDELVQGGYINPAGGILEKCRVKFGRDEGCAIVDWLRLNLGLAAVTGKARYWAMAERTLHNHLLHNQTCKGGFGHRRTLCDDDGVYGFGQGIEESTWCCTFHGELGFINVRKHLLSRSEQAINCHFVLDFSASDDRGTITSLLRAPAKEGEVIRQRLALAGRDAAVIRIRRPHWADDVAAVDAADAPVSLNAEDGWYATTQPVTEVELIYLGGIYAEDRRCNRLPAGPQRGRPFVVGYGPRILTTTDTSSAALRWPVKADELKAPNARPFPATSQPTDCCFVARSHGHQLNGRPQHLDILGG